MSCIYHSKNIYKILVTELSGWEKNVLHGTATAVMDFQVSYGKDFRKMFSYVNFVVIYGRLHRGLHWNSCSLFCKTTEFKPAI